jgi:hypothetical protein
MVGTPDEIGKELTRFLGGLEWKNVEAERFHTGPFAVQVEVEGHGATRRSGSIPVAAVGPQSTPRAGRSTGPGQAPLALCSSLGSARAGLREHERPADREGTLSTAP